MFKKYFTPNEARQQFPVVKKIVMDIISRGQSMQEILRSRPPEGEDQEMSAARRIGEEIETLLVELEKMGCYYKDWNFEIGLVDFPAIINDEEVFLCWRSDEADIGWYHRIEEGYASRKPLPMEWLL